MHKPEINRFMQNLVNYKQQRYSHYMKKIFILLFMLVSSNSFAVDKSTTFNNDIFKQAQLEGKTVVINSWNETCTTCKAQIKILDQAQKEFGDILFLSFEQTVDKDIAKQLGIDYWTTIVVYKNNKEVNRSIGQTDKAKIYELIKS
jgi:thioredoxin 1